MLKSIIITSPRHTPSAMSRNHCDRRILADRNVRFLLYLTSALVSTLLLWFLSRYKYSDPYSYAVFSLWFCALLLTLISTNKHKCNDNESNKYVTAYHQTSSNVDQTDLGTVELGPEIIHEVDHLNQDLLSHQRSKRNSTLIKASFLTITLSSFLIPVGLYCGHAVLEFESNYWLCRSTLLLIWIYAAMVNTFPVTERYHG